jgi:hypothetical protein
MLEPQIELGHLFEKMSWGKAIHVDFGRAECLL